MSQLLLTYQFWRQCQVGMTVLRNDYSSAMSESAELNIPLNTQQLISEISIFRQLTALLQKNQNNNNQQKIQLFLHFHLRPVRDGLCVFTHKPTLTGLRWKCRKSWAVVRIYKMNFKVYTLGDFCTHDYDFLLWEWQNIATIQSTVKISSSSTYVFAAHSKIHVHLDAGSCFSFKQIPVSFTAVLKWSCSKVYHMYTTVHAVQHVLYANKWCRRADTKAAMSLSFSSKLVSHCHMPTGRFPRLALGRESNHTKISHQSPLRIKRAS